MAATARLTAVRNINSGGFTTQDPHGEHDGADHQGCDRHASAEMAEPSLQGGLDIIGLLQERSDFAEFGRHAGGDHHPARVAVGDHRTLIRHVLAVAEGRCSIGDGIDRLFDRNRLAGEGRFIHPQVRGVEESEIGRDDVPGLEQTTSPGTNAEAGSDAMPPSRRTVAVGAAMAFSASMARSARYS